MTILMILNESPYNSERTASALRLAAALSREGGGNLLRLALVSDAVYAAMPNHLRPDGSANMEVALGGLIESGAEIKACVTCVDHRGMFGATLIPGVHIGNMIEIAGWVETSDRVLVY